jgi:hypothetical protein
MLWTNDNFHLLHLQAEDYIDELLNGDSYSDHIRCESVKIKEEPQNASEVDMKDRMKKDNHNMSKFLFRIF